ncbi:hypothetical protein ARMGADRAFT_554557 [Armillaria gallica]|uniref:Uncharacterized protein n=1 Tax=Armillaria gallica TaxID=47427 RepID=A0A2H3CRU3_ARMGA|nr:hypothetical protein ARMGADRAFT_554557 [Armillaria gallica]
MRARLLWKLSPIPACVLRSRPPFALQGGQSNLPSKASTARHVSTHRTAQLKPTQHHELLENSKELAICPSNARYIRNQCTRSFWVISKNIMITLSPSNQVAFIDCGHVFLNATKEFVDSYINSLRMASCSSNTVVNLRRR